MSDVAEKTKAVPIAPPVPTAKLVVAHRRNLELERDNLRANEGELAYRSSKGDIAARDELRARPAKLAGLQYELDQNHLAYEIAFKHDADAENAWRASIQSMDPEDMIAGIGRDSCCGLCRPNSQSGCVITAACVYAGSQCGHPVKQLHTVFGRDETGERKFLYGHNPQAARVFETARRRLKVPTR